MRDRIHLNGKGAAVFSEEVVRTVDCGIGSIHYLTYVRRGIQRDAVQLRTACMQLDAIAENKEHNK